MKMIILITIIAIFTIGLFSCDDSHDGEYVQSTDGKIYRLEWSVGRAYFLQETNFKGKITDSVLTIKRTGAKWK